MNAYATARPAVAPDQPTVDPAQVGLDCFDRSHESYSDRASRRVSRTATAWCSALVLALAAHENSFAQTPADAKSAALGPQGTQIMRREWRDETRQRELPALLYLPSRGTPPYPVIIFSHGLGGSREGYAYLGRYWASYGYVSVHLQHPGSDTAVWQGKANPLVEMKHAAQDPDNALERPRDVSFAIDQLERLNRDDPDLKGLLDLGRVGVAGHSFGAYTALAVAGQQLLGPRGPFSLADPRVKAIVAMSPPVPRRRRGELDAVYAPIKVPCLLLTGTRDDSPISETKASDRLLPFDHLAGPDAYLLVLNDADHMAFSDSALGAGRRQPRHHEVICQSTTAFWNAHLKQRQTDGRWTGNEIRAVLGKGDSFKAK